LVPIVAVRTAAGAIRVRFGNRRTLGAIEARVASVPVMVVADEATDTAAEIERIVTQHAENTRRAPLQRTDEVGVVATLLDLGLSPAQITKRTRMPRPVVNAAVTITGSELARAATARYEFLTLTQAAALTEFEDDSEAVKALVVAAQAGEVRFDHVAQDLRDGRESRATKAEAQAALEATGITVVDQLPRSHQLAYLRDAEGGELTEEAHRNCPGHGAYLGHDWVFVRSENTSNDADEDGNDEDEDEEGHAGRYLPTWAPVYVCTDPEAHGHTSLLGASSPGSKTAADPEEAKTQRRRVIANNKAWRSAETVRRDWLTTFLARKTAPKGTQRFVLGQLALSDWRLCNKISQGHLLACHLLGIEAGHDSMSAAMTAASEGRAQVIALAIVLGAYEDHMSVDTWRHPSDFDRTYLRTLVEWGYQLSEIEETVLSETDAS
jgi:hypothetical protein